MAGLGLMLTGCAVRIGPKTIVPDRFDYSSAIGRSWKEQMVLNMVKMRYLDPPLFMEVAQVVSQYTLEGSAGINAPDWVGGQAGSAFGASGRWAESPTITYNPLGERFIKSLLQPISPTALFSLVQGGWPIDVVLGVGVRTINGIHAGARTELLKAPADPEFYQLLGMLRDLQKSDAIGMRVQPEEGKEGSIMVFRAAGADAATLATGQAVRKLLKLSPEATEFSLAFGATPRNDKEIAVLTRSMLEIMQEAAAGVDVPASHLSEGRVVMMTKPDDPTGPRLAIPVQSSDKKPPSDEAYAAVRYRNHWFWISDRNVAAKRGLSFLLILFSLTETGITAAPPVLTISKP